MARKTQSKKVQEAKKRRLEQLKVIKDKMNAWKKLINTISSTTFPIPNTHQVSSLEYDPENKLFNCHSFSGKKFEFKYSENPKIRSVMSKLKDSNSEKVSQYVSVRTTHKIKMERTSPRHFSINNCPVFEVEDELFPKVTTSINRFDASSNYSVYGSNTGAVLVYRFDHTLKVAKKVGKVAGNNSVIISMHISNCESFVFLIHKNGEIRVLKIEENLVKEVTKMNIKIKILSSTFSLKKNLIFVGDEYEGLKTIKFNISTQSLENLDSQKFKTDIHQMKYDNESDILALYFGKNEWNKFHRIEIWSQANSSSYKKINESVLTNRPIEAFLICSSFGQIAVLHKTFISVWEMWSEPVITRSTFSKSHLNHEIIPDLMKAGNQGMPNELFQMWLEGNNNRLDLDQIQEKMHVSILETHLDHNLVLFCDRSKMSINLLEAPSKQVNDLSSYQLIKEIIPYQVEDPIINSIVYEPIGRLLYLYRGSSIDIYRLKFKEVFNSAEKVKSINIGGDLAIKLFAFQTISGSTLTIYYEKSKNLKFYFNVDNQMIIPPDVTLKASITTLKLVDFDNIFIAGFSFETLVNPLTTLKAISYKKEENKICLHNGIVKNKFPHDPLTSVVIDIKFFKQRNMLAVLYDSGTSLGKDRPEGTIVLFEYKYYEKKLKAIKSIDTLENARLVAFAPFNTISEIYVFSKLEKEKFYDQSMETLDELCGALVATSTAGTELKFPNGMMTNCIDKLESGEKQIPVLKNNIPLLTVAILTRDTDAVKKLIDLGAHQQNIKNINFSILKAAQDISEENILDIVGPLIPSFNSLDISREDFLKGLTSSSQPFKLGLMNSLFVKVSLTDNSLPQGLRLRESAFPINQKFSISNKLTISHFREFEKKYPGSYKKIDYLMSRIKISDQTFTPFVYNFFKILQEDSSLANTENAIVYVQALWNQNKIALYVQPILTIFFFLGTVFNQVWCRDENHCEDPFGIGVNNISAISLIWRIFCNIFFAFFVLIFITSISQKGFSLDKIDVIQIMDTLIIIGYIPFQAMWYLEDDILSGYESIKYSNMLVTLYLGALCAKTILSFRVFDSIRNLSAMLIQVFFDITPFITILTFAVLVLSMMEVQLSKAVTIGSQLEFDNQIGQFLKQIDYIYSIGFGNWNDSGNLTISALLLYIIEIFMFPLVMFNLLIAIVSKTFEEFQESRDVINQKQLIEILSQEVAFSYGLKNLFEGKAKRKRNEANIRYHTIHYLIAAKKEDDSDQLNEIVDQISGKSFFGVSN